MAVIQPSLTWSKWNLYYHYYFWPNNDSELFILKFLHAGRISPQITNSVTEIRISKRLFTIIFRLKMVTVDTDSKFER